MCLFPLDFDPSSFIHSIKPFHTQYQKPKSEAHLTPKPAARLNSEQHQSWQQTKLQFHPHSPPEQRFVDFEIDDFEIDEVDEDEIDEVDEDQVDDMDEMDDFEIDIDTNEEVPYIFSQHIQPHSMSHYYVGSLTNSFDIIYFSKHTEIRPKAWRTTHSWRSPRTKDSQP